MRVHDRVAQSLRAGVPVSDTVFDAGYAEPWQRASHRYWTPVGVALRAAQLLTCAGARRVLDVGAGPGKLCIVGALSTGVQFVGVEQRLHLVEEGRRAVRRFGIADKVTIEHDVIQHIDWTQFDGIYLFNPFGENVHCSLDQLDGAVELSYARYKQDIEIVERALDGMPVGARVVTFHGFGGRIPDAFESKVAEDQESGVLRLWVKERAHSSGRNFYVESTGIALGDLEFADP